MNVTAVEPKGDKGAALLVMENGARVWTPEIEKAKSLIGKPIPGDWTQKEGDYGPQAFPPRDGKKGAMPTAYRNTKEGQAYEQERMDRRTALMQAVTLLGPGVPGPNFRWDGVADEMYAWLRSSAGGVKGSSPAAPTSPAGTTPRPAGPSQAAGVTEHGGEAGNGPTPSNAGDTSAVPGRAAEGGQRGSSVEEGSGPAAPSGCTHQKRVATASGKVRCLACGATMEPT